MTRVPEEDQGHGNDMVPAPYAPFVQISKEPVGPRVEFGATHCH